MSLFGKSRRESGGGEEKKHPYKSKSEAVKGSELKRGFLSGLEGLSGFIAALLLLVGLGIFLAYDPMPWGYVSVALGIAFLIYFATVNWGDLKRIFTARKLRYGINATILTICVIGIVILLNIVAVRHRGRLDLTRGGDFTLSDQTKKVLSQLKEDVKFIGFLVEGSYEDRMVMDLLKEYDLASDKVSVEFVDPDKNPSITRRYGVTSYGTIVVESATRSKKINQYELFTYDYYYSTPQFQGEQVFTRALLDLVSSTDAVVYFLEGHGEGDINSEYSTVKGYLEGEGYQVKGLNLLSEGQVPDDASLLVIAGPTRDIPAEELTAIETYLKRGGRVFMMVDPVVKGNENFKGLKNLLAEWGMGMNDDLVIEVDPTMRYFLDALTPLPAYETHEITAELIKSRLPVGMPRSRSLYKLEEGKTDLAIVPLLKTSDKAWGETNLNVDRATKDADDVKGPLILGLVATAPVDSSAVTALSNGMEKVEDEKGITISDGSEGASAKSAGSEVLAPLSDETRIVLVGNSSFISNDVVNFPGNIDFFMNSAGWLMGREETVVIRPKTPDFQMVQLTGGQANGIFYGTVVVLPILFLLAGGTIWLRRRNL